MITGFWIMNVHNVITSIRKKEKGAKHSELPTGAVIILAPIMAYWWIKDKLFSED